MYTIIFDFDGTLVDSRALMINAYNRVAPWLYCKQVIENDVRSLHARDLLTHLNISTYKLPFIMCATLYLYKRELHTLQFFPDIIHMLTELTRRNVPWYIISSNRTRTIKRFLHMHSITSCAGIYSTGNRLFCKNELIKQLIKQRNLNATTTYYVGDELRDIQAGHDAGIKVMTVSWGYTSAHELEQSTDIMLTHPTAIIDYINS